MRIRTILKTVTIRVTNTNQAPVIAPLPVESGREGVPLQFSLAASDADGDVLSLRALAPLPTGSGLPRAGLLLLPRRGPGAGVVLSASRRGTSPLTCARGTSAVAPSRRRRCP